MGVDPLQPDLEDDVTGPSVYINQRGGAMDREFPTTLKTSLRPWSVALFR